MASPRAAVAEGGTDPGKPILAMAGAGGLCLLACPFPPARVPRSGLEPPAEHCAKESFLAVVLRLKRFGRLNHPTYRVCAADSRLPRDGRVIETLGYYLPKAPRVDDRVKLNRERIAHWLSVGAQPSETVTGLIRRFDIPLPVRKKRVRGKSKAKPKPFQPPKKKKKKAGGEAKKKTAAGS